jgi:uncharacterized membrane protein
MADPDLVMVLAASYDSVSDAEVDYEAIKALYYDRGVSHDFDAAVIERDDEGKVRVVKKHEQPTRHGAAKGMKWGLAIGVASAILPGIGLLGGMVAGAAGGAGIGAVKGHMEGGMDDDDLKKLGQVLDQGKAGLIAVYAANVADQIAASIKADNRAVSKAIDAKADELARQIKEAESSDS